MNKWVDNNQRIKQIFIFFTKGEKCENANNLYFHLNSIIVPIPFLKTRILKRG